jgi:hypothetical protein
MIVTGLGQCSLDYFSLVDSYPENDTKKEVLEWQEQGGGPVATALVALSRLGIKCRFCGVVGDDEAGEKIRRSLSEEGVEVKGSSNGRGVHHRWPLLWSRNLPPKEPFSGSGLREKLSSLTNSTMISSGAAAFSSSTAS